MHWRAVGSLLLVVICCCALLAGCGGSRPAARPSETPAPSVAAEPAAVAASGAAQSTGPRRRPPSLHLTRRVSADEHARLQQAAADYGRGRLDSALISLRGLRQAHPHEPNLAIFECVLRQELTPSSADALHACREGARLDSDAATPLLLLAQGMIGERERDLDAVRDILEQAAQRLDMPPAPQELSLLTLAYVDAGWLSRAERTARTHPDAKEQEQLLERAARVRRRTGLPQGSARYRIGPDEEPVYLARFERIRDHLRAERWVKAGLEREELQWAYPGVPGVLLLGCDEAVRRGQQDRAVAACQAALRAYPELPLAHLYAGQHAVTMGRGLQGLKHLRRAVELDPELQEAWPALGLVLEQRGMKAELQALSARYSARFGEPLRLRAGAPPAAR